ncbi:unnamed protein product [Triticum turgidum subsp. durum]|uniref:Disease resistance protein RPM1 n=1 Tax=Triticum turgidum subsp. durum TaxID=4567 RepID=A0A9R1PCX4_TRITD|nr:unnamed protein product [Triticum turgidum subsp. durum]
MELVVGASEATMKSLLAKLGGLLAKEYTLIRGVRGDLQYINDELATMQSFLRDLGTVDKKHGHRTKDWMKQIRDITYDIEDCIDDSADRIHGLRSDMCCYVLFNSIHEVITWWPRRDVATRISMLKVRAQEIGERRLRYGVNNPVEDSASADAPNTAAGFLAADNQYASLQLVTMKDPVGVEKHMGELNKRVTCIVGFGGVGKTAIATALCMNYGEKFDHRAMVMVSQSSDLEAILSSIKSQLNPQIDNHDQQGSSKKKLLARFRQGASTVMAKCCNAGASEKTRDRTKLKDLEKYFKGKSFLLLIDDVWSATMLENIINELPESQNSRIIVTTRFHAVATTRRAEEIDIRNVKGLDYTQSKILFEQALSESQGSSKDVPFLDEVRKMCGGLPLAIVIMAGHVACNPSKTLEAWLELCKSLFPESRKDQEEDVEKELTQEQVGRIVSHCYNDMPAEIRTCSLYLSIFLKGHRISKKRLTRRWIAEGFVCEKQGLSVEDVAEIYFNHLITRKIIRPVEHSSNGKVKKFIVHDMVLEHVVAKASEENFITVVGGNWLMPPPSSKVRRLSLQGSDSKHEKDTEKMNLSHVRSLTMFGCLNNQLPSHSFKFGIVQVLDLQECKGFKHHHMKEICEMLLLKYLSLRGTEIQCLPKEVGNLVNLETLDIRETDIVRMPKTVCQLGHLVNILGGNKKTHTALKLPEELNKKKKMKALRILSGVEVGGSADLHHLTELRKLAIYKLKTTGSDGSFKQLISSIEYLGGYSLRTLIIVDQSTDFLEQLEALSTPPKFLVALELSGKMVKLPSWIENLGALNKLTLSVTALRKDNLHQISKMKALFSLTFSFPFSAEKQDPEIVNILARNKLESDGEIMVPDGGFQKLKLLRFFAPMLPLLSFSENAMPKLERLELRFNMLEGLFGAENLSSLKEVYLRLEDKEGEVITKEIQCEMEGAFKRTEAKTPRIILDQ